MSERNNITRGPWLLQIEEKKKIGNIQDTTFRANEILLYPIFVKIYPKFCELVSFQSLRFYGGSSWRKPFVSRGAEQRSGSLNCSAVETPPHARFVSGNQLPTTVILIPPLPTAKCIRVTLNPGPRILKYYGIYKKAYNLLTLASP